MSIFTIGDLHLSTNTRTGKSMEVFGRRWIGYTDKLRRNWEAVIRPEDTVIIPGDISWALSLEEAISDLAFIDSLPGTKLIGKGNHDFWWTTAAKMNAAFAANNFSTLRILYNNAHLVENRIICGTRGWFLEPYQQVTAGEVDYEKIVNRESIRLRLSLDAAVKLRDSVMTDTGIAPPIAVFLHFPPVWLDFVCRPFVDILHEYDDPDCYFGHIHGMYHVPLAFTYENIRLRLVSSDAMDFMLYRLGE